jgi:putative membrane protein
MKRWMGWMLVGSLAVGGSAVAQDDEQQPSEERSGQKETGTQNGTDDTQGMFRMGEAEAIDQGEGVKDATGGVQGTGGSGMQAQGAQPDAAGAKLMDQGLLPIPTDEKAYLEMLHHGNQMEVQLGQLAQQKGVSKGVKDFGARLVKDHQAADQKVMTYATTKNIQLGEPKVDSDFKKTMRNASDAAMAKLQSLQGPAFDRAFLAHMVGHHDSDIAKVMAGQQQFASNAELKGQLDNLLPTLKKHRDEAYRLLGQEKPRQARPAPPSR